MRGETETKTTTTTTTRNMGRKQVNMEEEEDLVVEVRNYLCLYDKSCKDYKDKRAKANAWRTIEKDLGLEEGKDIFPLGENLGFAFGT